MTAGENQPEPLVSNGVERLGLVVVVEHLSLLLLAVALVLTPDPVDGFAIGGGGQPCAGIGGYAVGRPPHNGGRKRLCCSFFGDVEVTEALGQSGELERHVEVTRLNDPEPGDVLLRFQERPVGDYRLAAPVVDQSGRAGRPEASGEDPVALGLEPFVEHVDGSHLGRGGKAGFVVNHGNQIFHLGSSPVFGGGRRRPAHFYYEQVCPNPTPPPD